MHGDYDGHPETVDSEKELHDYLSKIAREIGWIIIHFNSLEDSAAQCLRELMLHDPYQDERLDVFLSEMGYQSKVRALIHLYGHTGAHEGADFPKGELATLEKALTLAATIRNGYAHADWLGLRADAYIKVKTTSGRNGVVHRYKRIDVRKARLDLRFIISVRDRLEAVHELVLDQIYSRLSSTKLGERVLPEIKYPPATDKKGIQEEARLSIAHALVALGYSEIESLAALRKVPLDVSLSDGIKSALHVLSRKRPSAVPDEKALKPR